MRTKTISIILISVFSVVFFVAILKACKPRSTTPTADVKNEFEMNPPIAREITIRQLEQEIDGGNILVSAQLPGVKDKFHAIMVNDEKLVLRDDGEAGDEKASDGIFSIVIKDDIQSIQRHFDTIVRTNEQLLKGRPLIHFEGRQGVVVDQALLKSFRFDAESFRRGIKIPVRGLAEAVDPMLRDRCLMVTDVGVIEDPARTFNPCTGVGTRNGAWTFGKLMTDMAQGVSVEDFARNWLEQWMIAQNVNSDPVAARPNIFTAIIVPWIQRTTPGSAPTTANWKTFPLDMTLAPFKLLAIVNRVDLRGNSGYTLSNAGEGRFVFGVLNTTCAPLAGPGKFTVIFEYGIPKKTCSALKAYATQWHNLRTQIPGTASYNTQLQAITDQFAGANTSPSKPNGSSLNQLRTNEFALGGPFWELREFVIDAGTHFLKSVTVKQEPAEKFNRLAGAAPGDLNVLANYVNTNEAAIIANTNTVPENFSGQPFLGGHALTRTPNHFWDGAASSGPGFITNDQARHMLSLNTCSGCHGGEGRTQVGNLINDPSGVPHNPFLQIAPQAFSVKPTLAAFLTGDPNEADGLFKIIDPAGRPAASPTVRGFNDLARRAIDLQRLVTRSCRGKVIGVIDVLTFKPLRMVH